MIDIQKMTHEELTKFIYSRIQFPRHVLSQLRLDYRESKKEHRRFDMSGYGDDEGSCQKHNRDIIDLFSDCGIYNYVHFFYLDSYKGVMTFYWMPWGITDGYMKRSYGGEGTVEILRDILKELTKFSGCLRRTS